MSNGKPISIWQFNLAHELAATSLAALALLAGSWFTLNQLEQGYLQLHRSDAQRVGQLLQEHLHDARQQLDRFAALPAQRQHDNAALLLPSFSDLYRLDRQHRVVTVLKASPGSRVFAGFSFAGSQLEPYFNSARHDPAGASRIERGLEDERASVYFVSTDTAGRRLLARLNLSYLQDFLRRYNQASGLPVLLVSDHGFVMLASDAQLRVAAVDLNLPRRSGSDLQQLDGDWLSLTANSPGIGGQIVTLIPNDRLEAQRRLVLLPSLMVALLALVGFTWKNRRLHQLLFGPVARFSLQIEQLRSCVARAEVSAIDSAGASSRFVELAQIEASFEALMQTVRQRDLALQQKLRTSLTAATIAHEINLPLSTIRIRCQQADQQLRAGQMDPTAVLELVQTLQADSQQVSRVIEKMRMLLRNVPTTRVPTSVAVVVNGAITQVKRPLRDQQVQWSCRGLDEAGALLVHADAAQLQMALSNLLRNAIEAVAQQPPAQRQVLVLLQAAADQVLLGVADSGPGFAGEPEADTLLRSSKPGGSGLGLFVVRTTLTNHQGQLRIGRSAELGGAEVWMQLPLADAHNYPETVMPDASQVP